MNRQAVQDLLTCMEDFEADPFEESTSTLRSLQSGVTASSEILNDLKIALDEGYKQANDILEDRVFSKRLSLNATISRNKRQNLASKQVCATSGACVSVVQMEKSGLATLMDFAENRNTLKC